MRHRWGAVARRWSGGQAAVALFLLLMIVLVWRNGARPPEEHPRFGDGRGPQLQPPKPGGRLRRAAPAAGSSGAEGDHRSGWRSASQRRWRWVAAVSLMLDSAVIAIPPTTTA